MPSLLFDDDEDRLGLGRGVGVLQIRAPETSDIEQSKALADNYNAVQKARADARLAEQKPIWSLLNPVGTEEVRPRYFTADTEFTPGATWGGRLVSQAFKDKVDFGSNIAMGFAGQVTPRLGKATGELLEHSLNPNAPGFADRISTRTPSEAQVPDVHLSSEYQVGADSFNRSGGGRGEKTPYQTKTADMIAQSPGFERFRDGNYADPREVHDAFTDHLEANIRAMYNEVAKTEWGPVSRRWYDGANTVATDTATTLGLPPRATAGMTARLSPGTPWDMNVEQMRRTANIESKFRDSPMTEAMEKLYREKYEPGFLPNGKKNPDWKPDWAENFQALEQHPRAPLKGLQGDDAGMFVRLFDEAHNPDYNRFRIVNPDGTYGAYMPNKYTPNSNGNIGMAISIMRDPSLENISRELGQGHKIRNFYNNIISPNAGSDITVDTHAMGVGNLMPWGPSRPEVAYGFGNSPQGPFADLPLSGKWLTGAKGGAHIGSDGLYPLYAEAYRRVADDLGILPRELQSMTWEGIKGLYEPAARKGATGERIMRENSDLWRQVDNGTRTQADAQSVIFRRPIAEPPWWARRGQPGEKWQPINYSLAPKEG